MLRALVLTPLLLIALGQFTETRAEEWSAKFDGRVRFYQATELGVLVVGTERSLYGVDAETGDVLWRRKGARLTETEVAPVPGTDVLLLSPDRDERFRLEAVDLLTGDTLWRSGKVRGALMQMAFDPATGLLAVVLARDATGRPRSGFKRKPVVHVFDMATGEELWDRKLESEVEMMPSIVGADDDEEVPYTLDNYRPPVFLDGRLYTFYEGLTSQDARTGRERRREKFRVNEDGLALTEADPIADERFIYLSGRGRLRAISRDDGEEVWESKDLGKTPELVLTRRALYARTGGQFTRLEDGETVSRGPYGVSAIDPATGKTLWRYKGADKGITNLAFPNDSTVLLADRDDLIILDAATGERRRKISHKVERAAFLLLNERGEAVVGGTNELAAFDASSGREVWRERHGPPGRGVLRTFAAVAARAASLYFRYGGVATTALRGVRLANSVSSLRWSGLSTHLTAHDLTSLAADYARERTRESVATYGLLSRTRRASSIGSPRPPRPTVSVDVEERLLDRLDPARQLERLSRYLWRRRRLAALRGQWMYFYTDVKGREGGRGLVGVNIHTGQPARFVRLTDPDARFISDETTQLLYVSRNDRLVAHSLDARE